MCKNLISGVVASILLLTTGIGFSQTNRPLSLTDLPADGNVYNVSPGNGTGKMQARAFRWYSEDRKSYLLLIAIDRKLRHGRQPEILFQVVDSSKEEQNLSTALRLVNKKQMTGLLSALKYEIDAIRAAREKGISFNVINDCFESDDCVQSSIGASVSEAGDSSASINLGNETGNCTFTFSPKEQYMDFVAKYEILTRWAANP